MLLKPLRHCIWTLLIMFSLISNTKCIMETHQRPKRTSQDTFGVLLTLYKMNPLRDSKVFKTFSNNILLPYRMDGQATALHFDASESDKEKQELATKNLKHIEDVIHKNKTRKRSKPRNERIFSVEDNLPEKFSAEKYNFNRNSKTKDDQIANILGHIESNETTDRIQTTYAVSETISLLDKEDMPFVSMENETSNKIKYSDEGVVIMR